MAKAHSGIRFNEHMEGDGETVFRHACKLGLEDIVSKRKDSMYRRRRGLVALRVFREHLPAAPLLSLELRILALRSERHRCASA